MLLNDGSNHRTCAHLLCWLRWRWLRHWEPELLKREMAKGSSHYYSIEHPTPTQKYQQPLAGAAFASSIALTSIHRHMVNAINSHHNWKLAMATSGDLAAVSAFPFLSPLFVPPSSTSLSSSLAVCLCGSCHNSLARHNHTLLRQCLL